MFKRQNIRGLIALSPLLFFIAIYLIVSIVMKDFYAVPITVAFLLSCVYAIVIMIHTPLEERIKSFVKGTTDYNLMLMVWIFVLAGAFAGSAKAMGSVDATVNLCLMLLPGWMIMAGLFIAACFISLAIGTSVGTIVALTPIAVGIAQQCGANTALLTAVIVGGAFFGDNLSFISDTTIVATTTQGCKLSDKFKANSFIVMPAAVVICAVYLVIGQDMPAPQNTESINVWKVIPYITVIITAVCGVNVLVVLALGAALTGIIGIIDGAYDIFGWFKSMSDGIIGMGELIIITLLASGLLALIKANGGIDVLIRGITSKISGKRGAYFSIAALVTLVDVCTANNTVAIITTGGIAKQISDRYQLDSRKCASILDTMSCFAQGLIPYGAQVMMGAALAGITPFAIVPYLYYPMAIGIACILSIIFRYPRRYA